MKGQGEDGLGCTEEQGQFREQRNRPEVLLLQSLLPEEA